MVLQLKLVGKRGVYKDTQLAEEGGKIYEKDGIIYNCAFSICDITAGLNQLHTPPWSTLLFFKNVKCCVIGFCLFNSTVLCNLIVFLEMVV